MSQIEVSKLTATVHLGPVSGSAVVPKMVLYVRLRPGPGGNADTGLRQGHMYAFRSKRVGTFNGDELGWSDTGALIWIGGN